MLRQMERSAIQVLAKRGLSQRQIAKHLGYSRVTVARALTEPVAKMPATRRRASIVDPYRPQIEGWLTQGLSIVRMLELARADPERPYSGSRAVFGDHVRRLRLELERATADVPVRFEGLPAEYLQIDWGEVARFPFTQRPASTRYFLACRLKYSRWVWVRFTRDMRQETLVRGLVDCFLALGWVPWVLVFDNMKTVTSGRDAEGQPVWTAVLLQLAAEFGFHPEACTVGAANQKGTVENLVKWVKGHFLAGRTLRDDADLAEQAAAWVELANARPCAATGQPPVALLPREAAQGGALPAPAHDYGLLEHAQVSAEALVHVRGNRYSVPVALVGLPVTVRLHHDRLRVWRDTELVADHPRAPDGARRRVVDVAHFAPLFPAKPRAQVMLYRQALLDLGGPAERFITEVSRRQRACLRAEVLGIYALSQQYGTDALLAAMEQASQTDGYSADALRARLTAPPTEPVMPLTLLGLPSQAEVDRPLAAYEALVTVAEVVLGEEVA
jgi:transposase